MSSEIHQLSDLHREVLNRLMAGWQTMDEGKHDGFVRLSDLSVEFAVPAGELRTELALLETFGLIDSTHSTGVDETQYYRDTEQITTRNYNTVDPVYFISENGKRAVLAEMMSEQGEDTSAAPA